MRTTGEADAARSLLEQNDRWYRAAGGGEGALLTRCLLAALDARTDRQGSTQIVDLLGEILDESRRAGDPEVQVYATDALAFLARQRGEVRLARDLLRAADALADAASHVVDGSDRVDADHTRAALGL
jgi:hypothetical protein